MTSLSQSFGSPQRRSSHLQNRDNLTFFFPIFIPLISFYFSMCLAKIWELYWIAMMKVQPCSSPHFMEMHSTFQYSLTMLAVSLSYIALIVLRDDPSISNLLFFKIMKWYFILLNTFSACIEIIICFLFFYLLIGCLTHIDLHMLHHVLHLRDKSRWIWVNDLLCWRIQLANVLLKILASIFIRNIGF